MKIYCANPRCDFEAEGDTVHTQTQRCPKCGNTAFDARKPASTEASVEPVVVMDEKPLFFGKGRK
jgi:hypothetical protein